MKNQIHVLKLSLLAGSVAAFAVGCASSGYARYDNDNDMNDRDGVGASAGASVGSASAGVSANADLDSDRDRVVITDTDRDSTIRYHDRDVIIDADAEGEARQTVTALSFSPVTHAHDMNRFPFYDWNIRSIDLYTFAVTDPDLTVMTSSDLPEFTVDLPPGSVYVESAGGSGEVRAGKIIQHSPNPGTSGF